MNFSRTLLVQIEDGCPSSTVASSFTKRTTAIEIAAQDVVGSKTSLVVFGVL